MAETPETIDPNKIKTSDPLILALIAGATKSGAHRNRKKDADRKACRGRYRGDE